jgi:glycerol-3-phosphate dehydrogenase
MIRSVGALADREWDLAIVGGGIFGACAAWEAASRGLSAVLVEQGDFLHSTSGNHFRMVHGGVRYLQHADIYRIRESCSERSAFLRIAPHQVHPLPIIIPTYGHGMQGAEVLRAGLLVYDLLTIDRNRGIKDPARHIPPGKIISRRELLEMFPEIPSQDLTGAGIFHDGQMHNPSRLGLSFILSAVEAGARAANYLEVKDFLQKDGHVRGVLACDRLNGDQVEIRARMVLNTAGPWASQLLREKLGAHLDLKPTFSRDACFIVNRKITGSHALTVLGKTRDPDAILSRGHRHLFLVPWQDVTLVGVWHLVHQGGPQDFTVTEEDLQEFIDEINGAYPPLQLGLKDVSRWMAGLVLFGEKQEGGEDLSYGHRSQLVDHARDHGVEGLITLLGVRATTARGMAEKAIDLIFRKTGKPPSDSRTAFLPVYGGEIDSFQALLEEAIRSRPPAVPQTSLPNLIQNHGTAYPKVLQPVSEDPCWAETLGESNVLKAEVLHAVREEMASKLSDIVFRRTDLGSGGHPGEAALREAAHIMAKELDWDPHRVQAEIDEVCRAYPTFS